MNLCKSFKQSKDGGEIYIGKCYIGYTDRRARQFQLEYKEKYTVHSDVAVMLTAKTAVYHHIGNPLLCALSTVYTAKAASYTTPGV